VNSGTKPIRQAMKNTYTTGTTTRRGQRVINAANSGDSSSVPMKVAL
jgi:hypothetical protein